MRILKRLSNTEMAQSLLLILGIGWGVVQMAVFIFSIPALLAVIYIMAAS